MTLDKINSITTDYLNLDIKFICLTETWCVDASITNFIFPGYELVNHYCRSKYKGGGVGLWHKTGLNVQRLDLNRYCSEKDIEVTGLTWTINS